MRDLMEFGVVAIITMVIIVLLSLAAMFGINRPSCYASFGASGMNVRWSLMGGCQVNAYGVWIPAEAYRVTRVDD